MQWGAGGRSRAWQVARRIGGKPAHSSAPSTLPALPPGTWPPMTSERGGGEGDKGRQMEGRETEGGMEGGTEGGTEGGMEEKREVRFIERM